MMVSNLIKLLSTLPQDWNVVLSKVMVLDKESETVAVVDLPVIAVAENESDTEIRFCINDGEMTKEQIQNFFHVSNVMLLQDGEV